MGDFREFLEAHNFRRLFTQLRGKVAAHAGYNNDLKEAAQVCDTIVSGVNTYKKIDDKTTAWICNKQACGLLNVGFNKLQEFISELMDLCEVYQ
jgi:hypothetical protein